MSTGYAKQDLLEFLDFLGNKGLMKKSTVVSRKAAVNTLLSILEDTEAADVRQLNIEQLMQRFMNLRPYEFKQASLNVYRSRLSSSLDEFLRYKLDPAGFKPQVASKERSAKTEPIERRAPNTPGASLRPPTPPLFDPKKSSVELSDEVQTIVFPIPIRPGVIVKVSGIPSDLTPEEAEKIGNVVLALSGSQEN